MTFNSPGVYIQDVKSGAQIVSQASSSVGVLLGATRSGKIGEAQLVSSFTEFINLYANGLDTPFTTDSVLPYSVHGFFTNGGQQLYIVRVASESAKCAKATFEELGVEIVAKYEGTWANDLKITIKKNEDWSDSNEVFDVTVELGASDSSKITEVTTDTFASALLNNTKVSKWIKEINTVEDTSSLSNYSGKLTEKTIVLADGADGVSDLTDSDYTDALKALDVLDDVTLVAIPGQTSLVINDALMAYCDNNSLFPILDMPIGSTVKQTKDYRKSISAKGGCLCYPWGRMNDPLTNTLKTVPTCGHVMGVYARTIEERGVHKAPAGTEAVVRGFVEMETALTGNDVAVLNPVGVICIQSRPNAGIVIWGARALTSDTTMRYVSDVLLNYNIKRSLYNGTQFSVFEPNDESLWKRVEATCKAFLESMRKQGSLVGTKEEAYYVTVDKTNNTKDTIDAGFLNIEIGYAPSKPAEFVVIKLAHSIEQS